MSSEKAQAYSKGHQNNVIDRIERMTQVGHWTYDIDTNSLYWSEQIYAIHGLSQDMYNPEVESAISAYIEEDRAYVIQCMESAIENGESFVFECRIKRTDDKIRSVLARGECELNEHGETKRVFGTFQDITELKLEQERLELALAASNTAIWDWNIETDEVEWYGASANILDYPSNDDLPSTTVQFYRDLLHKDSREQLKRAFVQHFKHDVPLNEELKFKKGDSFIWMLARGSAQKTDDGRATRIIGSLTDISKLKHAENELLRSNNDLDQFASITAHDLQQPLRSISGFMEILHDKYYNDLDEQAQEYIRMAISGAQNMSELISDLLEYSRLQTDGMNIEDHDIAKVIQRTTRHLIGAINESGAKIKFENMPTIACDGLKLQRVFYNLIENGIKYKTDKTPEIKITAKHEKRYWHFIIEDNGIGIPNEKLDDIFLMFNRLHKKTDFSGTGIGLAICKKVIDLHGGKIWAQSMQGTGSKFHFTLPDNLE